MGRALAFLFGAGATLVGVTLLLPHESSTTDVGVLVPVLIAFVVTAGLLAAGARVSVRSLHGVLGAGTVLITQCVIYGGDSGLAYALMYVWVALYACYFFRASFATAHVVFAAALYAGALTVNDDIAVPHVNWLMSVGTVVVGALLVGRLTQAIREQSADLAAVAQMATGLTDVSTFGRATCEGLHRSTRADVVIMLEPTSDEDGMQVAAMSGAPEAGLVFTGEKARDALEGAFRRSEPHVILADEAPTGLQRFEGMVLGLAQPILRDGVAVGVLALGWTSRRRSLPERAHTAALLFAAEASVALDRAERASRDRERAALEINDNIVQGLVVAKYLATSGNTERAIEAIDETLARARRLITDQLDEVSRVGGRIEPGDLARREASRVGG